jgi:hypothetical protein
MSIQNLAVVVQGRKLEGSLTELERVQESPYPYPDAPPAKSDHRDPLASRGTDKARFFTTPSRIIGTWERNEGLSVHLCRYLQSGGDEHLDALTAATATQLDDPRRWKEWRPNIEEALAVLEQTIREDAVA